MKVLLTLFFLACAALAAPLDGIVRGGGIPLPGAAVTATQGTTTQTAITAADGSFAFADLAPGVWTLKVAMTGFTSTDQQVTIPANGPVTVALSIAPYQGPALSAAPPPPPTPKLAQRPATPSSGQAGAPPPSIAPAPDALAVNGSVDNGASSQFGISPAFGNARPRVGALFNGAFGLVYGTSALDARSFSLTGQDTPKPGYNNLTGLFQFGGPLLIPHLTHAGSAPVFFVGYQKSTRLNAVTTSALVPTLAERSGDLTALGGPVLSPGAISAQAAALLALYPQPNVGGAQYNYQASLDSLQHQDRVQARIAKSLSFRNQFSWSMSLTSTRGSSANLFGFLDGSSSLGDDNQLQWRHSFSQGIFGTFSFDFSRLASRATPFFANRVNVAGSAGILGGDTTPATWGPPSLGFSDGFAALNDGLPLHNRNQTAAASASIYWNHQDHNITFGGDLRRQEYNDFAQQNPRGGFTFNGAATGNAFQDFLQGLPDTANLAFGNADKYFRENNDDIFFADDWRATDSLSLNLGGRWEYSSPIVERYGRLVNLGVTPGFSAAAPVLGSPSNALVAPDRSGIEPRLGLAWRPLPASSLLIRAGYGLYRDTSVYQSIALEMSQQAPLSTSLSVAAAPGNPLTLATALQSAPGPTPDLFGIDPNFRIGYAQTWNASLQRDLPAGMVMTLSYLGTKGTRGTQRFYPNTYAPGAANPCPACPVGFLYEASNGSSTYESGKAQLQRRFHNGLAATVTYTYAHAIDDSSLGGSNSSGQVVAQNWLALDAERARSSFDQRHNLSVVAQYSTGSGIRGGALMRGWRGPLLKGWTLTSQLTAGSGLPLTPTTLITVPGTGFTGVRPDATGANPNTAPPGLFVNPAAFAAPVAGQWGTVGRDSIQGPSQFTMNAALQRSFDLPAHMTGNLRIDSTNVLNHVAFTAYNTLVGSPQFGLPSAFQPMRSLQTTFRVTF